MLTVVFDSHFLKDCSATVFALLCLCFHQLQHLSSLCLHSSLTCLTFIACPQSGPTTSLAALRSRCEHITVKFQQRDLEVTSDWDTLTPGSTAEYAWDEPMAAHRLRVVLESATEAFRDAPVQEYNLDDIKAHPKVRLGRAHSKMVQRVANVGRVIKDMSGMGNRTQSMLHVDQPELDARFVYVGVHADGPTRVLCFSETKDQYTRGSNEESMSLLTSKLARLQERIKASKQQLLHTPPVIMCALCGVALHCQRNARAPTCHRNACASGFNHVDNTMPSSVIAMSSVVSSAG